MLLESTAGDAAVGALVALALAAESNLACVVCAAYGAALDDTCQGLEGVACEVHALAAVASALASP